MSQEELYKSINPLKFLKNHLEQNVRPDGRELEEIRPTIINKNSVKKSDGSALVKIGDTTVICSIKAELCQPDHTSPNIGYIVPNIELSKLCSPKFRAVGVSNDSQVFSQTLFNILVSSECLDPSDLCIAKGKLAWVLYCDLICLDDSGSVLDVAVLALSAALKTVLLPKVEYDVDTAVIKVDNKNRVPLKLKSLPVACTFMSFEKYLLADPSNDEESIADSLITISTCDGKFNYISQPGGGNAMEPNKFEEMVKHAVAREKYIKSLLNSII